MQVSLGTGHRDYVHTSRVVFADLRSCSLPAPECGSSSSVMRKIRFDAVFGALEAT